MNWRRVALVALALFVFNVAINLPLFRRGETLYRDSIEGGYASMAHFIARHPNPWGWNPTWYCGLPTQFTYLPALPYATAAVVRVAPFLEPYHAYRLIASTMACLVPVSILLMVFYFTRSLLWAILAGLGCSLWSPLYEFISIIDRDRGYAYLPWRLQVLVKYGEGPHNAALVVIPMVVIATRWAARASGFAPLFAAAALMALVTLTNWVGALALASCGALLLAAFWDEPGFSVRRVVQAALIGYGLACFWLTPTFVRTIAFNWPQDAWKYKMADPQMWLLAGLLAGVVLVRGAFFLLARNERYLCWLVLCFFHFGWIVLWRYQAGVVIIPEARRYALEFEIFLFLLAAEILRRLFTQRGMPGRVAGAALAGAILYFAIPQAWSLMTTGRRGRDPMPKETTIEYKIARKLNELQPGGRVYVTGGTRFRLNSWFLLPQPGGGFESGLRNRLPIDIDYQIRTGVNSKPGEASRDAINGLKSLGVEYAVVHGRQSREHHRDIKDPHKFDGLLEEVYREEDDVIFRVPFAWAILARYDELIEWPGNSALPVLTRWVNAMEDPARPKLKTTWAGPSEVVIEGPVTYPMLVSTLISFDEGWEATQDGEPVPVLSDNFRFLLVHARPAAGSRIHLRYGGTPEQRRMAGVSAAVWLWCLGKAIREWKKSRQGRPPGGGSTAAAGSTC